MDSGIEPKHYTVQFDETALSDLKSLPKQAQAQILKAAKKLVQLARPSGSRQLKGYEKLYRLRTGDYRIIYAIENDILTVLIVAIGDRKQVYEDLSRRINR
ncbi:type II toxin-antitoxin system RelE family toxin [Rudanella lutea]|jgi:mRNA interferase RelE/StbE|uniref:type II toxin-antitoxin system RelE family toxin n=1 Tax=Rudanella lutea TaxID=451374 RepID=UPI000360D218|nr:type II toxin-antitoxin system RelE/ParE family toxin [Rudanella lutea]